MYRDARDLCHSDAALSPQSPRVNGMEMPISELTARDIDSMSRQDLIASLSAYAAQSPDRLQRTGLNRAPTTRLRQLVSAARRRMQARGY